MVVDTGGRLAMARFVMIYDPWRAGGKLYSCSLWSCREARAFLQEYRHGTFRQVLGLQL